MKKYHYTYILRLFDGREYIGVRSSVTSPELDSKYLGSSKYIKKQDVAFKSIIETFETRQEAIRHEIELHDRYDVCRNPNFANRAKQTVAGFDSQGRVVTEETRAKMRGNKNCLGYKHPPEFGLNVSRILTGRKHKETTKEKIGRANRGLSRSVKCRLAISHAQKGNKNCVGRVLSQETKNKIAASVTPTVQGLQNPRADQRKYRFEHRTLGLRVCTRFELCQEFGITSSKLTSVINGRQKSTGGWSVLK